ncbi:MAG: DUF6261 family protein [Tannerellaceae bacterium]|nr:DUF6261 family protein [Tannerellaceae bacterium]
MKAIKSARTLARRQRNAEHFDFHELVLKYGGDKELKPAWPSFRASFAREDAICKPPRAGATRLISEARKERKNACMALKRTVEAAAYSNAPVLKAAANELARVLDNCPHVLHAPITEASAMIANLVQDLQTLPRRLRSRGRSPQERRPPATLYLVGIAFPARHAPG